MSATPFTGLMHNTSDAHTIMSSTSSVRSVTFAATQLQALRARVKGRVFVPGDEGYDTLAGLRQVARWHTHRAMAMLVFLSCARSGAARLRGVSESLKRGHDRRRGQPIGHQVFYTLMRGPTFGSRSTW